MAKKKKEKVEFRYYEIPQNEPLLALMGDKWIQYYGHAVDFMHFHNLLEIGYCYFGVGDLVLEDKYYRFGEGMTTSIPKNFIHTTQSDPDVLGKWEYLFLDADAFLGDMYKGNPVFAQKLIKRVHKKAFAVFEMEQTALAELVKAIFREMREKKEFYSESTKGLMLSLLLEIARINDPEPEKIRPTITGSGQIAPALDYVSDYYFREIKIEELADACHMSETHFRRVFEECMNMPPLEYVNLVRIQMACDFMKKGKDAMSVISQKVGFVSQTTFNRNFKRVVGTTPYQWKSHPENYEGKLENFKVSAHRGW